MKRYLRTLAATLAVTTACIASADPQETMSQQYPDVIGVEVRAHGTDTFDFDVTISSPYDTPRRYANAFRVMGADGHVYGKRPLLHDHANEQPFTRELYGVTIPQGVRSVVVQGRDQQYGYGGKTVVVELPGR